VICRSSSEFCAKLTMMCATSASGRGLARFEFAVSECPAARGESRVSRHGAGFSTAVAQAEVCLKRLMAACRP